MKVRLSESMIRFRLTQEEVASLSAGSPVFFALALAPTSLTVRLEPIEAEQASANARGGLRVGIPAVWLHGWSESDTVGFEFSLEQNPVDESAGELQVVVEKDFPCSHDGEGPPKPVRMP